MAILEDPLFSEEARGTVGQLLTFKRSKVHPVACAFTDHPVNWTPGKIAQAAWFKSFCDLWRSRSIIEKDLWSYLAPGVLTGFNYFIQLRGIFPYLPPYTPPSGNELFFNFIIDDYIPPAGDQLNPNFGVP